MADAPEPNYDEEEIKLLLLESPEDIRRAIDIYHRHRGGYILQVLRSKLLPVDDNELWEVYQDTLIAVMETAESRQYEATGPLDAYVIKIATNKAIDRSRRNQTRQKSKDALISALRRKLVGTEIARSQDLLGDTDYELLVDFIWDEIGRLPEKQQQATTVWFEFVLDERDIKWPQMAAVVRSRYHVSASVSSVKTAAKNARDRLRDAVRRRSSLLERDIS